MKEKIEISEPKRLEKFMHSFSQNHSDAGGLVQSIGFTFNLSK